MAKDSTVRPWLAAVLTLLVTGLGHVYLRQWFRALTWFGLIILTGVLLVPDSVIESPMTASLEEAAPILFVAMLAVVDAYFQARRHNSRLRTADGDQCAECGRELDPDISFCQWCTAPRTPAEETE